jgi:hypothetical protein
VPLLPWDLLRVCGQCAELQLWEGVGAQTKMLLVVTVGRAAAHHHVWLSLLLVYSTLDGRWGIGDKQRLHVRRCRCHVLTPHRLGFVSGMRQLRSAVGANVDIRAIWARGMQSIPVRAASA